MINTPAFKQGGGVKQNKMKVQELRLGNYVHDDEGVVVQVRMLLDQSYKDYDSYEAPVLFSKEGDSKALYYSDIKAISLSCEWLEKLGALKDEHGDVFIEVDSDSDIRLYLSTKRYIQLVKSYHCPMFDYEHTRCVHQLQNLYHALTGKELMIKKEE